MKLKQLILLAGVVTSLVMMTDLHSQDMQWSPDQVFYGSGGKLAYTPDEQGNTIPDFSHVGYMYGDEPIPDVPTVVEISPVEGDDGANIRAAIDQLKVLPPDQNGFRGAVLLKKGTYQVLGQIKINVSGIVLRGEGQTDEGTVIIAEGNVKRDFIVISGGSGRDLDLLSQVDIVEDYVPLGRKFVVVEDASSYSAGDKIALYRPGTQNWISDIKMDQISNEDGQTKQWTPGSYSFYFERLVTEVRGDTIFFRNPVVMAMEAKYGGGKVLKCTSNRIEKVGVENLCLKSAYTSEEDENHAWVAIKFNTVQNSWARNVTSWYFGYACASIDGAHLVTIENCHCREPKSLIAGGHRYSFNIGNGSMNLFKDCTTTEGRHDFVTGSRVCGPNVFTNCTASDTYADSGPHHRWAMGTLYDVIVSDGKLNVQDRGQSGSGHGWAGANQVFWNCDVASSTCQSPWASAKNYSFGLLGSKGTGVFGDRPDGVWVGHNRQGIFPQSLYQAQWEDRVNDVRIFAVYPALNKVNDSTFIVSFNMPFFEQLVSSNNFVVGGDAGFEGADFSTEVLNDTSVTLVFDGIGPLPAFSSVEVKAQNMINSSGKPMEGLTYASYFEPDLRPVVSGEYTKVNNEDGVLEASSSKPGSIYLIRFNEEINNLEVYQNISYLDSAVQSNQGRNVDVPDANTPVSLSTEGLPGGYYIYFAMDQDGRISEPADAWPEVEETGPVWEIEDTVSVRNAESMIHGFSIWSAHGEIFIQPDNHSLKYEVQLFDLTGRAVKVIHNLQGDQQLAIPNYRGIYIMKVISENGTRIETHKILNN